MKVANKCEKTKVWPLTEGSSASDELIFGRSVAVDLPKRLGAVRCGIYVSQISNVSFAAWLAWLR